MTFKPLTSSLALLGMAAPVQAHLGHFGHVAGHDHWVAGAAIGAAVAIGLWGAMKGKKQPEAEAEPTEEPKDEEPA